MIKKDQLRETLRTVYVTVATEQEVETAKTIFDWCGLRMTGWEEVPLPFDVAEMNGLGYSNYIHDPNEPWAAKAEIPFSELNALYEEALEEGRREDAQARNDVFGMNTTLLPAQTGPKTFEYRVIDHDMIDEDEVHTMNSMGSKGWEIIRILDPMKWMNSDGMFIRIYYKREKIADALIAELKKEKS